MTFTIETFLIIFLLATVVFLCAWMAVWSNRYNALQRDTIKVMTATEITLRYLQYQKEDQLLEFRIAILAARDMIVQKIELLAR